MRLPILVLLLPFQALSQPAQFQTATIRASAPGTRELCGFLPEARFECRGATALKLIATAYSLNPDSLLGGPDWLDSDRFDVIAKAPAPVASPEALRVMLQILLANRFGLAVHYERKDMPAYLLTVARKPPKLHRAASPGAPDCPSVDGPPGMNHRACRSFSMADLSRLLPQIARNYVDRPVVDMTGLAGAYDFPLDWMDKAAYLAAQANPDGPPAVSMFDAIGKLELKLEPGTSPTPVIVIDRVNRPTAEAPDDAGKTPALPAEFEAAEVRPAKPGIAQGLTAQNGRVEILGYTLRQLIAVAFNVKADRIVSVEKWLDTSRFDVIAKSPEVMSPRTMAGMLKALIVQRFKLQTHAEDQPAPVFALVLGKGKPKLKESPAPARSECKLTLAEMGREYVCRNTAMAQLVERLPDVAQAYLTRPLVDLTGLTGAYDFTLSWTPKSRLPAPAAELPPAGGDVTLFEAIDKQLGLKVEERNYPMPVIVIDHAERIPDGNE